MPAINEVVSAASTELGIKFYPLKGAGLREGVFSAQFRNTDLQVEMTSDRLSLVADWFHEHNYLFTYQHCRGYSCAIVGQPSKLLAIGYHVTRTSIVQQILEQGLLKGTLERCNSERSDTVGSVYVSAHLEHAFWWQEFYTDRLSDEFSILQLNLINYQRYVYLDPFSTNGYAIRADVDPTQISFLQ